MKQIAIAIPTHNRNYLLKKLISSIPKDVSISISDNGAFVTEDFKHRYHNITVIQHREVISIFKNWNSALSIDSNPDFLAIPSDDDLYIENKFHIIKETISNHDADIFIFGNNFIDENDNITSSYCPSEFKEYLAGEGLRLFLYGIDARMPIIFFIKTFLDKIGNFDAELFSLTAADSELVQRALLLGKAIFVPEIVASYRVWSGGLTDQKIATTLWMSEVEAWTRKIKLLALEENPEKSKLYNWEIYQDEVYARNLVAGIGNQYRAKKYAQAIDHFKAMRFPHNALFFTKLRLFKYLFLAQLKKYYAR